MSSLLQWISYLSSCLKIISLTVQLPCRTSPYWFLLLWFHIFRQSPSSFSPLPNKLFEKVVYTHTISISWSSVPFLHHCFLGLSPKSPPSLSSRPSRISLILEVKNIILLTSFVVFNTFNPTLLLEIHSLAWMIPGSSGFSPTSLYLYLLFFLFWPLDAVVSWQHSSGLYSLLILHTLPRWTWQF